MTVLPSPAPGLEADALVYARISFARMVKKLPRNGNIDTDDLWGAALLGAAKALDRFDPERGSKFASFAISYINGEMLEEMRRQDWLTRADRARARAEEADTGEYPEWAVHPPSLEDFAGFSSDGEVLRVADLLLDPEADTEAAARARIEAETVRALVDWLPERERRVIRRSWWDDVPGSQIAVELHRAESRVHQLRKQAHDRLREWAIEEGLVEAPGREPGTLEGRERG